MKMIVTPTAIESSVVVAIVLVVSEDRESSLELRKRRTNMVGDGRNIWVHR
jgi:hypothetical protein